MFCARLLRQAATVTKKTTGIHGYPVHPDPKPELSLLYNKILHSVKRLPETSTYRVSVESATKQKLDIVESTEDLDLIEKTINDGQLEQLIEQAKAEIKLISKMEEWKAWEPLEEKPLPDQWEYKKL